MWYFKLGHLLPPLVFFVASLSIFLVIRSQTVLDGLDRVTLYQYSKASVDRGKALRNNTEAEWAWLRDQSDADRCLDMTTLNFPGARFASGSDPTGPNCRMGLVAESLPGQPNRLKISVSYLDEFVLGCSEGRYPLVVSSGSGGPVSTADLFVGKPVAHPTIPNRTLGTVQVSPSIVELSSPAPAGDMWGKCMARREKLAMQYVTNTSCEQESSQMCSCVLAFAARIMNPSRPLAAVLPDGSLLQDVLLGGVEGCIQLRRAHDLRASSPGVYLRSWALLSFALAVLFNAVLYLLDGMTSSPSVRTAAHSACYLVLLSAYANGANVYLVSVFLLPAIPLLAYDLFATFVVAGDLSGPKAYLHPVAFSVCLCSLTLFTLVERGVVQTEYLIAELFKCHGIAAVYAASAWYHRHSSAAVASCGLERAHRLLVFAALAAAADTLLIPYPSKEPFHPHWLLPLAFVYFALVNPEWTHALIARFRLAPNPDPETKLRIEEKGEHMNSIAAAAVLTLGLTLMGYFLVEHIRVYGSDKFAYPTYLAYHSTDALDKHSLPLLVRSA